MTSKFSFSKKSKNKIKMYIQTRFWFFHIRIYVAKYTGNVTYGQFSDDCFWFLRKYWTIKNTNRFCKKILVNILEPITRHYLKKYIYINRFYKKVCMKCRIWYRIRSAHLEHSQVHILEDIGDWRKITNLPTTRQY